MVINHYLTKIRLLGIKRCLQTLYHRVRQRISYHALRKRVNAGQAEHTISEIFSKRRYTGTFAQFLSKKKSSDNRVLNSTLEHFPQLLQIAENAVDGCFTILGSGKRCFTQPPWHLDIRLQANQPSVDCSFDATSFYADIVLDKCNEAEMGKDIKVPWELNRFQHLLALGLAYNQKKDQRYVDTFCAHITDWLDCNPYLFGINWLNPMEVALRAINWISAFAYFKDAPSLSEGFWKRFVASLYDHLHYLEHNWEWYDSRTNNHYLSNLVGYYVLLCFFSDLNTMRARKWCVKEIEKELDKQILNDGLSYEGSTAYHWLVTELAYLFFLQAKECDEVPEALEKKINSMIDAIDWLTPYGGSMVTIGDDDSATVLCAAIVPQNTKQEGAVSFPFFGISVIKTKQFHITFRHHAYQSTQPSGHFHNDMLSITLAVDGIPTIVDGATYVYTPSTQWRNYFRSMANHNSFYLEGKEPVALTNELFSLTLPNAKDTGIIRKNGNGIEVRAFHDLYSGLRAHRKLLVNRKSNTITLEDNWLGINGSQNVTWHLMLGNTIRAQQKGSEIFLFHKDQLLVRMCSDLTWRLEQNWLAQGYGCKLPTVCLRATIPFTYTKKQTKLCIVS